jgi:putative phosphoribosyl transferase
MTLATIPVTIDTGSTSLDGELAVPPQPSGLVVFVHGSGSSRLSPRNRYVAEALLQTDLGVLLFDLLTPAEERSERITQHLRFDIELLANRVLGTLRWLRERRELDKTSIGLFGASTGAAAALVAAARRPGDVGAIVSRGGRPDLAGAEIERVIAPTLLVVGGNDRHVLDLNRDAIARMRGPRSLYVIPGAGHLFEEPGALDEVIRIVARWFREHLPQVAREMQTVPMWHPRP